MANLSSADGTVVVKKVGKEFKHYARVCAKNYYSLIGFEEDINEIEDKEDLEFTFSNYGRWAFQRNLENYLDPQGMWHSEGEEKTAYDALYKAIIKNNGSIEIEYDDEEGGNDWKGSGYIKLDVVDGEVVFEDVFKEE